MWCKTNGAYGFKKMLAKNGRFYLIVRKRGTWTNTTFLHQCGLNRGSLRFCNHDVYNSREPHETANIYRREDKRPQPHLTATKT